MGVPLTVSGRCTLYALLSTHWHTPNAALLAMLLLTLNQLKPAELPSDPDCPSQAKLVILTLSDLLSVQWQQLLGISPRSTIVYTTEAILCYLNNLFYFAGLWGANLPSPSLKPDWRKEELVRKAVLACAGPLSRGFTGLVYLSRPFVLLI